MAKAKKNKKMKPSKIGTSSAIRPNSSIVERASCVAPSKHGLTAQEFDVEKPPESARSDIGLGADASMRLHKTVDEKKRGSSVMRGIHITCRDEKEMDDERPSTTNCEEQPAAAQFSRQHSFKRGISRGGSLKNMGSVELRSVPEEQSVREYSTRALKYIVSDNEKPAAEGKV